MIWRYFVLGLIVMGLTPLARGQQGVEPVKGEYLIACLPRTPEGYKATQAISHKAAAASAVMHTSLLMEANRSYEHKTRRSKSVSVTITDGAYNKGMYEGFENTKDFETQGTEGYTKGYRLATYPVMEIYYKNDRRGILKGVVEGRFIIQITGTDVGPGELVEWWYMVDLKQLKALH